MLHPGVSVNWEEGLGNHDQGLLKIPDRCRSVVNVPGSSWAGTQLNLVLNINIKKIKPPDKCCSMEQGDDVPRAQTPYQPT